MTLVYFCKFAILSRPARWPGALPGRDACNRKDTDMAQMTKVERNGIEDGLKRGWTIPEIAAYVKRPPQTVTNEIKNRRIDSSKGFKETNSTCRWYGECRRTHVCGTNCGMDKWCKHCHQCFLQCRDYEVRTCDRLIAPPFVCNGCTNERICHLPKKFYVAKVAQADRESKLHVSRSHVHASEETLAKMNDALKDGLRRNQSVRHIMASNADAFGGLSERTVYNYIGSVGLDALDVGRGDLPYACSRRPRPKPAATKTDAKCRVNRTHDLFVLWKEQNPGALVPEADTLKGRIGGDVLFTIDFPCQLMMAFHKERETAQTWTGIVNMLYRLAGRPLFMKLFPAILEDNGAPFSDPVMTENARADNNPYRLVPRTKVFYCDPYCATQKPHVERNHEELRRILLKGTSFNALDQDDINVALSHVNSYTRASLGNSTPYDEFARTYGYEGRQLLDHLGIVKIPANEVTLDPYVLGKKFKRHADRIILRQNGVK